MTEQLFRKELFEKHVARHRVNRGCATAVPYTNYYARAREALPDPRPATRITKTADCRGDAITKYRRNGGGKTRSRRRRLRWFPLEADAAVADGIPRREETSAAVHNTEIPLGIIIIVGQRYIIIIVIVFASLRVRLLYTRHVYGGGVDGGRVLLLCFIGGGLPSTIIMMILK